MRWTAALVGLTLLASGTLAATPAHAVTGYDSRFLGESAFLTLAPGEAGQFAVGFDNTGTLGWSTGTASQVNLAVCLADKVSCNVASPNAAWASGWTSATAYATHSTTFVGPGQTGWFVYGVRAPSNAITGTTVRFNGDLVLAGTGELIHAEGYYQDATVAIAAAAASLDLQPSFRTAQIGTLTTLSASVTAVPAAGGPPVPLANTVVTFDIGSSTTLNPKLTLAATTNASGVASLTYTRNNPGTDSVAAYLSGTPAVRDTAEVLWTLTASAISVTPDTAETRANDAAGCRTYSYTATDPATGAALSVVTLYANFIENINRTADGDGGATIVGDVTASPTPLAAVPVTTDASGNGTFQVCGNGSTATVTPMLYDNRGNGHPQLFETGDTGDAGGSVTFRTRVPVITVTPDTAGSIVTNMQRVYTITGIDQFGAPYTGPMRISFRELHDGLAATTTSALVAWVDNDASPSTVGDTGGLGPIGTTDVADTQNHLLASLNASGIATFGVYATSPTSATPLVFRDINSDTLAQADEPQDVGGAVSWSAATLSSCTLTRNKTFAARSGVASTTAFSDGDVFFVFTYRDQSGSAFDPSPDAVVTFTIVNTGGGALVARPEGQSSDATVGAGATATLSTLNPIGDADATLVLDAAAATSVSVTASSGPGGTNVSCGPVTVTWHDALAEPTSGSLSGTVTHADKGGTATDGGAYILQTAVGSYLVTYATAQTFIVLGTTTNEAGFESALSTGDTILWTYNGGAEAHNITSNAP